MDKHAKYNGSGVVKDVHTWRLWDLVIIYACGYNPTYSWDNPSQRVYKKDYEHA